MSQSRYTYYLQAGKAPSLRRYAAGAESGQRWDDRENQWTNKCAPRASCVLTKDQVLTEDEAAQMFPGCVRAVTSAGARTEGGGE